MAFPIVGLRNSGEKYGTGGETKGGKETEFHRRLFMDESPTKKISPQGREKGPEKPLIKFSPELTKQLDEDVRKFLTKCNEMIRKHPDLLSRPAHRKELDIYNLLTDKGTKDINSLEVDEKIKAFLGNHEGMIAIELLMEDQTARKMEALGLLAHTDHPGKRYDLSPIHTRTRPGQRQGQANRFWYEKARPFLEKNMRDCILSFGVLNVTAGMGGRIGGLVGGVKAGSLIGAAKGLVAGSAAGVGAGAAAIATAYGVRELTSAGLIVDLNRSVDFYQMIRNDPQEAAYAKAMYGIDVDAFEVQAGNIVRRADSHFKETASNREALINSINVGIQTRREFYTTAGVPENVLDVMGEDYIYRMRMNPNDMEPENTGATWDKKILERFNARTGGIRDNFGRTRMVEVPPNSGNWVDNPYFDSANLDTEGNIRRYQDARSAVITEYIQDYIERKVKEDPEDNNAISGIDSKITARKGKEGEGGKSGESGERYNAVIDPLNTQEELLTKDSTDLTTERGTLETYRDAIRNVATLWEDMQGRGFPDEAALNAAVVDLRNSISDRGDPNSIASRKLAILAEITTEINRLLGLITTGQKARDNASSGINKTVTESFEPQLKAFKEEEERIEKQIAELQGIPRGIREQQGNLLESQQVVQNADRLLTALSRDNASINSWNTITVGGVVHNFNLTDADLITTDIHTLLQRINNAYNTDPTHSIGWPQGLNSDLELRKRLEHAVIEARARQVETGRPNDAALKINLNQFRTWGITENQLRTLDNPQLLDIIHRRNVLVPAEGWPPAQDATRQNELIDAINEARSVLQIRIDAYNTQGTEINNNIIRVKGDRAIRQEELRTETRRLELAKDLLNGTGKARTRVTQMAANGELNSRLTDNTYIAAGDPQYTAGEHNLPRSYLELLNILFDYKTKTDRADYFNRIRALLPESRLIDIISTSQDIIPPPVYFEQVMDILRDSRHANILEWRRIIADITNSIEEEALAI